MNQSRTAKESQAAQRHLEAAATSLLAMAPHTSAFLTSQRQRLNTATTREHPQPDRSTCNACGQTFVPGWSCAVIRRAVGGSKQSRAKGVKKPSAKPAVRVRYECSLCHSTTSLGAALKPPPPEKQRAQKAASEDKQAGSVAAPADKPSVPSVYSTAASTCAPAAASGATTPTEANRPDKKRSRKQKQGSLQALLAKSKAQSASPAGFDLMDFMKTG